MYKENQLYLDASKKALENSRLWLDEANYLLFERQSYGHSCSLSLFSIEETVKSFICFLHGLGFLDKSNILVRDVFKYHKTKIETRLLFYLFFNTPLLRKSMFVGLDEDEIKKLKEIFENAELTYSDIVKKLLIMRIKGMYVDIVDGKIDSPTNISSEEAEACFFDSFQFYKAIKFGLESYEKADENLKKRMLKSGEKYTKQILENLTKINL